jgi:hypothetical protein
MDNDELHESVKKLVGESFILILPNDQKIVTDVQPMDMAATLAAIVSSLLNGGARVEIHDDGDDEQDNTKGMN